MEDKFETLYNAIVSTGNTENLVRYKTDVNNSSLTVKEKAILQGLISSIINEIIFSDLMIYMKNITRFADESEQMLVEEYSADIEKAKQGQLYSISWSEDSDQDDNEE